MGQSPRRQHITFDTTAAALGTRVLRVAARPLPYGLMAHVDTAGGQHFVHHAQAERKAEVQPRRRG